MVSTEYDDITILCPVAKQFWDDEISISTQMFRDEILVAMCYAQRQVTTAGTKLKMGAMLTDVFIMVKC